MIKDVKKEAKKTLKKNYWRTVAVVFFISIMVGSFTLNSLSKKMPIVNTMNLDIAKDAFESITNIRLDILSYKPTRGILANIFNNVTSSGNFIFGILNSLNQLFFHERIWASLIILFGAILTLLYWLFIKNALYVGEARFFLESKNHKKTNFKRIFLPFKIKKMKNICYTMTIKTIKEWIWWLTIVGGCIKHYAYALVPYILAENPGIDSKTAIKLSEQMMKNHKWQLFKLDLSFLLWNILDLFTFHLLSIIYIAPYRKSSRTEFYYQIKELAQKQNIENINLLNDTYLLEVSDTYPKEKFLYKEQEKKSWLNTDFNKNYSLSSLILMFFSASIIGWLWEVTYHLFQFGNFVNRGALHGPWLPIYGWGCVLLLVTLKKCRKNPILTFFLAMIICGIVEYGTAWYLETFKNTRWWDYDGFFLNLHGRICLEGLIAFGIGGCAFIYFAAPFFESLYTKTNKKIKILFCILLGICYITDQIYSSKYPNTGSGVSEKLNMQINQQKKL